MAAGANNWMQTFLTALVNELTEPKVANFLKGMGLRLSAENLLPAGSWPKGSNVMDEMMEGTLLSVLIEYRSMDLILLPQWSVTPLDLGLTLCLSGLLLLWI